MKSRNRLVLLLSASILVSGFVIYFFIRMPVAWYDQQGIEITRTLQAEFDLPMSSRDPRESIWHRGKAYISITGWKTGSQILIYGVTDSEFQEKLLQRTIALLAAHQWNDVWIYFYDSAAEKSEAPPLRVERLSASHRSAHKRGN